jgi:hypothetical protein
MDEHREKLIDEITERAIRKLAEAHQKRVESEPAVTVHNPDFTDESPGQSKFFWNHPPRCIVGFTARPVTISGIVYDGHGSPSQLNIDASRVKIEAPEYSNPVFWLLCSCGHDTHFVLGHYWRNPDYRNVLVFVSPLALRCGGCGKVSEMIDTDIHGYDGEIGDIAATHRGEGERAEFVCDKCGPREFQVFVRFEYPDDLFDGEFDKFRGREQDLFTWFSLIGKCVGCGRLLSVTDFECA